MRASRPPSSTPASAPEPRSGTVVVWKGVAALAAALVLALPIGSFFVERRLFGGAFAGFGHALFGLGAFIGLLNSYLSFVRPLVQRLRRPQDPRRSVTGIPLIGMAVLPGLALAPPSAGLSAACLVLLILDTGNIPWFVVSVWRSGAWSSKRGAW